MEITGAIFDMDGTLIDSMHLWRVWDIRYLAQYGIVPTEEQRKALGGMNLTQVGKYLAQQFPELPLSPEDHADEINHMQERGYFHEVTVKPGVIPTLQKLQDLGVPMVVATATERYLTEGCLRRLGLLLYFDEIFTTREEGTSKNKPDLFLTALEYLGTPKESTWIFEDTLYSIRGAKLSGCPVAGVEDKWSAHNREEIRETCDLYLTSLDKIPL